MTTRGVALPFRGGTCTALNPSSFEALIFFVFFDSAPLSGDWGTSLICKHKHKNGSGVFIRHNPLTEDFYLFSPINVKFY